MHYKKWLALTLTAVLALGPLTGCGSKADNTEDDGQTAAASSAPSAAPVSSDSADEAVFRTPATVDLTGAVEIGLNGTAVEISGSGANEENGVISITSGGTYVLSGTLQDGCVIVDAKDKDVTLVLNGADITCSDGSPLYIYHVQSATVHLMEGTQNTLTDGTAYTLAHAAYSAAEEEPNACLYSKDDLVLQGAGALEINANYNNGITGKDTLEIYDLTLTVNAANHGVNGKDSNTIDSAKITVNCGGDAIRSTNDTDETMGWISVSNSHLDLTAGEDGMQAETAVSMCSGDYRITAGGGSAAEPGAEVSAKGVKAGTDLILSSGVYTMDCSDDAFHTNGNLTVSGGVYTVSTGDDAFHADEELTVSGGTMDILTSYEGLEGSNVTISGGDMRIVSSDDGVNAAGGMDASGFGGRGMGNSFTVSGTEHVLAISGGSLVVDAGGDGLDSNGSLSVTGGTLVVSSASGDNSALDCDGGISLSGGTVWAASYGTRMMQTPRSEEQCVLSMNFGTTLSAGTFVEVRGGEQSFVYQTPTETQNLIFSSPALALNAEYTISYGGTYDGTVTDCVGAGGTYAGGTELATLTLSDYVTTCGEAGGMGAMPGGGGGKNRGDWNIEDGAPSGMLPDKGTMKERPENGGMGGRGGGAPGEMPERSPADGLNTN